MNVKYVLGIGAPVVVILVLILLSGSSIGLSTSSATVQKLSRQDVFTSSYDQRKISVQEITLINDFFLSRRYELPDMSACLYDREQRYDTLNVGTYYDEVLSDTLGAPLYDRRSSGRHFVDVPAYGTRTVRLHVNPYRYYNMNRSFEYDDLLLVQGSCRNLNTEMYKEAVHIQLV